MIKRFDLWKEQLLDALPFISLLCGSVLLPLVVFPSLRQPLILSKEMVLLFSVGAALFFWLLRTAVTKQFHIRKTILDIPLLLFFAIVLITSLFSSSLAKSFGGVVDEFVLHSSTIFALLVMVWLMLQEVRTQLRWQVMMSGFLFSSAVVSLLFLLRSFGLWSAIPEFFALYDGYTNTVSQLNSVFGLYVVISLAIAAGVLLIRSRSWWLQALAAGISLVHLLVLLRIDFPIVWIFAAAVSVCIIWFGWYVLSQLRIGILSGSLLCLVLFVLFASFSTNILTTSSHQIKEQLPSEVTISAATSWNILSQAALQTPKVLLLGVGPAHFEEIFSLYRPVSFNNNPLVWSLRFRQPYSSAFELLSAVGLVGVASFLVIVLISIGALFTSWRVLHRQEHSGKKQLFTHSAARYKKIHIGLEGFFIGIAWLIATVGMFFLFYDAVMWWAWWWLLAMSIIGVSVISPNLIKEKQINVTISLQQALLVSFLLVLVFVAEAIAAVFLFRYVRAEMWYTRGSVTRSIPQTQQYVANALTQRPDYPEYRIAYARGLLEQARQLSEQTPVDEQQVAVHLAESVSLMKTLTEERPQLLPAWETLAIVYMNSRAFAANANDWATDALEQALVYDPNNPVFYWQLGNTHEFAKRYPEAERAYKKAIELKQDYLAAYLSFATLLEKEEKYTEAIAVYEQLLAQQPDHVGAHYHIGRMYFNRNASGDLAQAEVWWNAALAINPRHVDSLYSLGLLKEQQGKRNEARQYYQAILDIDSDNTQAKQRLN